MKGSLVHGAMTFTLVFDSTKRIREEWAYYDVPKVFSKKFFGSYKDRPGSSRISSSNLL